MPGSAGGKKMNTRTRTATTSTTSAASESAAGIVELATTAETQTGSDTARAVTPAAAAATYARLRVERPMTALQLMWTGNTAPGTNVAHYQRIQNNPGPYTISKIGVYVGTSSGNICLALMRGANSPTGPTTRIATTGSVACPAGNAWAEITLGASYVVDPTTDWFAVAADNGTVTLGRFGGAPNAGSVAGVGTGSSYRQTSAFPIPATPTPDVAFTIGYILYGAE